MRKNSLMCPFLIQKASHTHTFVIWNTFTQALFHALMHLHTFTLKQKHTFTSTNTSYCLCSVYWELQYVKHLSKWNKTMERGDLKWVECSDKSTNHVILSIAHHCFFYCQTECQSTDIYYPWQREGTGSMHILYILSYYLLFSNYRRWKSS